MSTARVLALGGAGEYGRESCKKLAASAEVAEVVVAGRDLDRAARFARELGEKGGAVQVDVADGSRLASLIAGSDLVVNTAGPEFVAVMPALRAAIDAGVDYCDLCCLGPVTEQALALDRRARASGVTAVVGAGIVSALTSLLMTHACRMLDRTDVVKFCIFQTVGLYGDSPEALLATWRELGQADASWQLMMRQAAGPIAVVRGGRRVAVEPREAETTVALPSGRVVPAYPLGFPEPITLPRALPGVPAISVVVSFHPVEANAIYLDLGHRVARGELTESAAAIALFEWLTTLPAESLAVPEDCESSWVVWAEATGTHDRRPARARCWPVGDWDTTAGPLATVALKILRAEMGGPGVRAPEEVLEPLPFFAEVATWIPEAQPGAPLLVERIDRLE